MSEYEDEMVASVSAIIKMEMVGLGLRQQDLADRLNIRRETISRYLGGRQEMPVGIFFQIAEVLGVSAADIMARAESRIQK